MNFEENKEYNAFNFILQYFDKCVLAFDDSIDTKQKYYAWRENTRSVLKGLLGFDKMKKAGGVKKLNECECNYQNTAYTRTKLVLNTMDGLSMPLYVLTPREQNGCGMLALHGHGSNGKEGLVGIDNSESIIKFNYRYALEMTAKGYTVFVPDLLGAGERCIPVGEFRKPAACNDLNNAAMSFGMSLQGIILFELLTLMDMIEGDFAFNKIGCVGFSGGGNTAIWLSGLDDRIDFTIVSGYFHSFRDVALTSNWCGCNFVPNLWRYADVCDIAALSADKHFFAETGDSDNLNGIRGIDGAYEAVEKANKAFKLFDNKIEFKVNQGGHKWYGSCYEWLEKINI